MFDRVALLLCLLALVGMHIWLYVYALCWEEEMSEEMSEEMTEDKDRRERQRGREAERYTGVGATYRTVCVCCILTAVGTSYVCYMYNAVRIVERTYLRHALYDLYPLSFLS